MSRKLSLELKKELEKLVTEVNNVQKLRTENGELQEQFCPY
jgi:hypothetical protein